VAGAGAPEAAAFEGRVLGVPALLDNLAVVYSKTPRLR